MATTKLEQEINSFLLGFIDFLYAVIFGFVLQEVYEKVLLDENLKRPDKLARVLLVFGVFYFLMSDWIYGRILIARNPLKGYRRFFTELAIAFSGYGAAIEVTRGKIFFLVYIVLVLLLGAYWAHCTIREYPESEDKRELRVIRFLQPFTAFWGSGWCWTWYRLEGDIFVLWGAIFLLGLGWLFDFLYDLFVPVKSGITGGPGVRFVGKKLMIEIRRLLKISVNEGGKNNAR